ncbi:hypothetical protein Tco_0664728 [Tanacetum coccineum]
MKKNDHLFIVEWPLEAKAYLVIWLGHVRGLEGDEEGLVDVLVKLETSLDELFIPLHAAARNGRTRNHCTLPIEGTRSIISTVSISLEGFLLSILLLMVIIVAVVIVTVIRGSYFC